MNTVLFYIIIFLTNVIQGITGFAGTILAMPPSLILVGYDSTVMVHISNLRNKIEEDPKNPKRIKTVKGLGYKLEKESV